MDRGQLELDVGTLVKNGKALSLKRMPTIHDDAVPTSDPGRLTRLLIVEVIPDLTPCLDDT